MAGIQKGIRMEYYLRVPLSNEINILDRKAIEEAQKEGIVEAVRRGLDVFQTETGKHATDLICEGRLVDMVQEVLEVPYRSTVRVDGVRLTSSCRLEGTKCLIAAWDHPDKEPSC